MVQKLLPSGPSLNQYLHINLSMIVFRQASGIWQNIKDGSGSVGQGSSLMISDALFDTLKKAYF